MDDLRPVVTLNGCDCHEHYLEHVIWQCLTEFERAVPPRNPHDIVQEMRESLRAWQEER